MKKTKTGILFCKTLCLLIYFLFFSTFTISAQHQEFSESFLQLSNPVEKYRLAIGYADKEILYDSEAKLHNFFNLLTRLASIQKDTELLEIINYKAKHHWLTHNLSPFDKIEVSEKFLETNLKQGNLLLAGHDYHFLAQQHFILQQYENAFESYLSAFQCFEKIGFQNVGNIDMFLHDFALANYYFKNYQEVIRLMYLSLQFPASNKRHDIQRMNNLGLSFLNLGCNDSAIFYLNKTSELAKVYNDFDWLGISSGNIGNLYYNNQQYQEALSHYKDQQDYLVHTSYEPPKISSYINLAKAYIQLDSFIEAHEYLNKAEYALNNLIKKRRYGEEQQLKSLTRKFYEEKYQLLAKEENFKEAIKYRDSVSIIQTFIDSEYNTAIVKISEDKVVIASAKVELENITKKKSILNAIYISFIILIIASATYISLKINTLRKKNMIKAEKLYNKNKKTEQEKQEIEIELIKAKSILSQFKTKILEQNETIELFEQSVQQLTKEQKTPSLIDEKKNALESLKNVRILTDKDWIYFQSSFKSVYPTLLRNINNHTPIFTLSEKRFLMLVKLGFNNKEMAGAVGVSEGAIRITWKRIREKVGLSTNESPSSFINKLDKEQISL